MKSKMIVPANKKGLNYYSPLIAIMGILILGAILSNLFVRQYNLASEFDLGREQFRVLIAQSYAEKALLFVDDAAKLALEKAAYSYGKNGFYQSAPSCGSSNGFNLWTKEQSLTLNGCAPQQTPCYPTEGVMKSTFQSFFSIVFESFVRSFNEKSGLKAEDSSISIPFSYEPFTLSPVAGRTEVIGNPKEPISLTATKTNKLVYEIKPSFRESLTPDIIADGNEIAGKAPQLLRKNENEIRLSLASFNSQNPGLKWNLASYTKPSTTCPHTVGTCTYCDEYGNACVACEDNPCCSTVPVCVRSHEGSLVEIVSYNDIYAAVSVANGKSFYVSDPQSSQPQLKGISYDFGLNWLEETGRSTRCDP